MFAPPSLPCPHCEEMMPPGFHFCRACFRELTFDHRAEIWTAQSRAHFPKDFPLGPHRLSQALAAAISHLRQHGTALTLFP